MIYFTSDLHFYHTNIIKYCSRPFHTVKEMNETLISNYNSVVSEEDTVYILGDITIKRNSSFIDKIAIMVNLLRGTKHLILGNHDKYSEEFYLNNCGFASVNRELELDNMVLVHEPMRFSEKHSGKLLLHGHCHFPFPRGYHDNFLRTEKVYDVGVDANNYRPVSLMHIEEVFNENNYSRI